MSVLPIVDADCNINIHILDGLIIKLTPASGAESLAGKTLAFVVLDAGVDIALTVDAADGANKYIRATAAQLANVPEISNFAVVDRTTSTPFVIWSGRLTRYSDVRKNSGQASAPAPAVVAIPNRGSDPVVTSYVEGQAAAVAIAARDEATASAAAAADSEANAELFSQSILNNSVGVIYTDTAGGGLAGALSETANGDTFTYVNNERAFVYAKNGSVATLLYEIATTAKLNERINPLTGTGPMLFVIAGQSEGLGANSGGPNPVNPNVFSWDAVTSAWVTGGQYTALPWTRSSPNGNGGNNNYALALAHEEQIRTGRKVYIVMDGTGGTAISAWVGSGSTSVRYAALRGKVAAALATAPFTSVGKTQIDALIWAQGQEDYLRSPGAYRADLGTLNTQLRAETWMPKNAPVFAMGMSSQHDRYWPAYDTQEYCEQFNQNWVFVSMKGLTTTYDETGAGDFTHHTGPSLYAGGQRIAAALAGKERNASLANRIAYKRGGGLAGPSDEAVIVTFNSMCDSTSAEAYRVSIGATTPTPNGPGNQNAWSLFGGIADGNYTMAIGPGCVTANLSNYGTVEGNTVTTTDACDYFDLRGLDITGSANYVFARGRSHDMTIAGSAALGTFSSPTAINGSQLAFRHGVGTTDGSRSNAFAYTLDGAVYALKEYRVGANKVVGSRQTGFVAMTGTATKTVIATGTATVTQLAERLKALDDAMRAHGLID